MRPTVPYRMAPVPRARIEIIAPYARNSSGLRLVVELEGERPVRHRGAGAQRRRDERRLGDFFPRGACLLRVPRVDIEAIRALRRAGHRERDQLAILARNLTVVTPDDLVELDEALELRRRELLELRDDFQVVRVVIVAHAVPPCVLGSAMLHSYDVALCVLDSTMLHPHDV